MRIAILHGIIQQYWAVYKNQTEISVSVTMALEETQDITDIQDIINILTQVLFVQRGLDFLGWAGPFYRYNMQTKLVEQYST